MKLVCKNSGEVYHCEHFLKDTIHDTHPIFHLSRRDLLAKAGRWGNGEYTEVESRLLFLALLNSTEAVEFSSYAIPAPSTVATHMEAAFKLVAWVDTINPGTLTLPSYRISAQNYQLNSIGAWFETWWELREDWAKPSFRRHLQEHLAAREHVLYKLIHSPHKQTEQYAGRLASWAMDAANVPLALQEYWTELFRLRAPEVYKARLVDLEELVEHMQEMLYSVGSIGSGSGSEYAATVLKHVVSLRDACRDGPLVELQGRAPYTFLDVDGSLGEDIESKNTAIAAARAPLIEPVASNYPGKLVEYIKARAAWTLARMQDELPVSVTNNNGL